MLLYDYYEGQSPNGMRSGFASKLHPGDVSRHHIAGFLCDPIRAVRKSQNGKHLSVQVFFDGYDTGPMEDPTVELHDLVNSSQAVADYRAFQPYTSVLDGTPHTIKAIKRLLTSGDASADLHDILEGLRTARIRGGARALRHEHDFMVKNVRGMSAKRRKQLGDGWEVRSDPSEEERFAEIPELPKQLDMALPQEVYVSE